MPWLVLTLELDEAHTDAVSDALLEAGAISVSVEDADAGTAAEIAQYREPEPGRITWNHESEATPWRRNRISALVPAQSDARRVVADAMRGAGLDSVPAFTVARLEDDLGQVAGLAVETRGSAVPARAEVIEEDAARCVRRRRLSAPEDAASDFDPMADKIYRHPTFYRLPPEVDHM